MPEQAPTPQPAPQAPAAAPAGVSPAINAMRSAYAANLRGLSHLDKASNKVAEKINVDFEFDEILRYRDIPKAVWQVGIRNPIHRVYSKIATPIVGGIMGLTRSMLNIVLSPIETMKSPIKKGLAPIAEGATGSLASIANTPASVAAQVDDMVDATTQVARLNFLTTPAAWVGNIAGKVSEAVKNVIGWPAKKIEDAYLSTARYT